MIKDFDIPVFGNMSELVSFLECDKPTLVKTESYSDTIINDRDNVLRKLKEEGKLYIVTYSVTHLKYGILEKHATDFEVYSAPEPKPFTADIVSIESSNVGYVQFKIVNKYRNMFNNENFRKIVKLIDSKNKHFNLYREALNTVETSNDGLYVNVSFKVYGDAVLAANIKNIDTLEFDFKCTLDKMEATFTKSKNDNFSLDEINTFNHRQLGKTDEWLKDKIRTSSADDYSDYINMWNFNANSFDTILDTTKDLKDLLVLLMNYEIGGLLTKMSEDSDKLNNFMDLFNKLLIQELGNIGLHTRYKLKNEVIPKLKTFDALKEFLLILVGNFRCTGVLPYSLSFATDIYLKSLRVTKKDDTPHVETESSEGIMSIFKIKTLNDLMAYLKDYGIDKLFSELEEIPDGIKMFIIKLQELLEEVYKNHVDSNTINLVFELKEKIIPNLTNLEVMKMFIKYLNIMYFYNHRPIDCIHHAIIGTIKNGITYIDNKEANESISKLKEHTDMLEEFHVGDEPNFTDVIKLKRKYNHTSTDLVTELSKKTQALNVFIFKLQYTLRKECSRYNDTKTVKLVEELEKHIIPRLSDLDILKEFLDLLDVNYGDIISNPLNNIQCICYAIVETMNSLRDKGIIK